MGGLIGGDLDRGLKESVEHTSTTFNTYYGSLREMWSCCFKPSNNDRAGAGDGGGAGLDQGRG